MQLILEIRVKIMKKLNGEYVEKHQIVECTGKTKLELI